MAQGACITITVDSEPAKAAVAELTALREIDPAAVNAFLAAQPLEDLFVFDYDLSPATEIPTDHLAGTFRPADRVLEFTSALRARHL